MALTRRTARFGELTQAIEAGLAGQGIDLDQEIVDQILRNRIDAVAEVMRVTPRTALGYAPDNLPEILTSTVIQAIETMPPADTAPQPDLRIVDPRD